MKFAKLIRRNLFRNKLRTILTMMLLAVIFFFVATLLAILDNFENFSNAGEGANRLVVQSAISLANLLPYAHEQKIRAIPGVVDTAKLQWIGAYYKEKSNFFANFAVDVDKFPTVFDDYKVSPQDLAAFQADRRGALVGVDLMKRFNWKVGDRITLKRQIFPFDPELTIRGTYVHPVQTTSVFFPMEYFQQSIGNQGQVGTFWVKVADPKQMAAISQQIDAMFKNSDFPTETFTEKEFQQNFMSMMGNVKLLFTAVSTCAIFMVVLLAAITMSMSARERVTEIAVLKAIGFEQRLVLAIMLSEFVLLTVIGGAIGSYGAHFLFIAVDAGKMTQGFLQNLGVHAKTLTICMATAVGIGLVAGGFPAVRASNLRVVDGLRRVV
ncbi:MAG: ABC transporter permease [Acidobacteria bacterium]|nr:ABC transporter permease [Acidobacteriota bacterium]MBV9067129.1 ABC transporter permease [Acidobacteriota bacterium]MBV9184017.1 ABC transporter permease [Acidobacteriota bacterium]